jgi:sugar (pentulose or hexulose) kinase
MTAIKHIAVLDIGKTNAKVVVLDCSTGTEVAAARIANKVLPGPLYPHFDVESLWAFVLDALRSFAHTPGYDAISITAHGAALALLDAEGGLALPILDYEHVYPDAVQQAYDRLRPGFAETFSPRLSGGLNAGAQLHFQRSMYPEDFSRVRTILTYPQYWAYRLSGVAANEVTSLGCHTDLWRPSEGKYSALVDTLDIRDRMAPIRSAFDVLGPVLPAVADKIGLRSQVPVFCGIHDSNATLLPHLMGVEPPFAVVSTGTWVVCFAVGGDLAALDPRRDTLANVDAHGRAVPSARFMGGREFEILVSQLGPFDQTGAQAAIGGVIAKRVMLLPNLAEGSGPFANRQGGWINDEGATAGERWAAACLYLALMTQTCLDLVGAAGPCVVEGPFALNDVFLSVLASLLGREVIALPGLTGTSQGAALLCGGNAAAQAAPAGAVAPLAVDLTAYSQEWRQRIGLPQMADSHRQRAATPT